MPMSPYMRELRQHLGSRLLEIASVSVACRDADGRVLLVKHSNGGIWVTPGGAIEPLETPADAAVRETWEEAGVQVELRRILGVYGGPEFVVTYENGDRTSYVTTVFEAVVVAGEPRADGVEVLEARFFTPAEAEALPSPPWMHEVLRDVFRARERAGFRPSAWRP